MRVSGGHDAVPSYTWPPMATGIGETLRAARRRQGRSLSDAAAETRVRETYLAALEEEEFAALGGSVYVKGFLRSYARFLGLDPEPLIDAYRTDHERQDERLALSEQRPVATAAPSPRSSPAVIVVAAGVALLVLAAIGMLIDGGDDPEAERSAPPPVPTGPDSQEEEGEVPREPSPAETSPTVEPTPTVPPLVEGVEVVLTVTGTVSWMRVQVDGETVIEGERANGFTETFSGEEEVVLRIGDASAVAVEANGVDQGSLGESNEVVLVTCTEGETECDLDVVA